MSARPGAEFADADVVAAYIHRPAYPSALFDRLTALAPGRGRAVDLGCGPGKLALGLAPRFDEVIAIDPSAEMLAAGRAAAGGGDIRWVEGFAETADLPPPIDLAVAGASIHWMDPAHLFPRLDDALATGGALAILGGDEPSAAPWLEAWRAVLVAWVERLGGVWNGPEHRARNDAHKAWFDVAGTEVFAHPVTQPVEALIAAEHSRATWARFKMGALADTFDADLRAVLAPHAGTGAVSYEVETRVTWGRPRRTPRPLR
jgi:SAM-dependent methyltransferase